MFPQFSATRGSPQIVMLSTRFWFLVVGEQLIKLVIRNGLKYMATQKI